MTPKRKFAPLLLIVVAGSARAQHRYADSDFTVSMSYRFGDLTRMATDVTVTDLGLATYNRVYDSSDPRSVGAYAESTGGGTVQQYPWSSQGYDPSIGMGSVYFSANTFAFEATGTARSSFGEVQTLEMTNHGTQDAYVDFSVQTGVGQIVDSSGDHLYPANYASLDLAFGVVDESDPSLGGTVTYVGDDTGPVVTKATGWNGSATSGWSAYHAFFLGAGQTHTLRFFAVSDNEISLYAPVPEPASLAALGLGALAVLRRRKWG